jgi:subtilisin family serine protease
MKKNIFQTRRTPGVLLLSALALQGCGNGVSQSGAGTVPLSEPAPLRNTCNPPSSVLSIRTGNSIARHFTDLTALTTDAQLLDRDVKGNLLTSSKADEPTIAPWAHKDLKKDGIPGTSTDRAYAEPGLISGGTNVVVAVIDSGLDLEHEDLKAHAWVNDQQDPAYPGAVHGWNFLGGKAGSVNHTTLEVTRELKRMRALHDAGPLTAQQAAYLTKLETAYANGKGEAAKNVEIRTKARNELEAALTVLKENCKIKEGTLAEVKEIQSSDPAIIKARDAALVSLKQGRDLAWYKNSIAHWIEAIALNDQFYYNLDFDSSSVVGDHPALMDEAYGNADITPVNAEESHATHVAGIIGAVRGNGIGMDGQTDNVRIMSLRAVPDGDERDKDVGNAIKFAVDHGARVINMSFGKMYASAEGKAYVWKQLKYAASKEVLLVHAAGNSSQNNDNASHYPDREVRDEDRNLIETIPNVVEVGASSLNVDKDLPAGFSDYGSRAVDLFAPGAQIYSSTPGGHYAEFNGTSMAAPEVAGIAALVLSQFPRLTALQLKEALLGGADTSFQLLKVSQPGADPTADPVLFGALSRTGGLANAYLALKAAPKLLGL